MTPELSELAATIAAIPSRGRGRRYPPALRERTVMAITAAREAGHTWESLSGAVEYKGHPCS